jgi:hypothetical protein
MPTLEPTSAPTTLVIVTQLDQKYTCGVDTIEVEWKIVTPDYKAGEK